MKLSTETFRFTFLTPCFSGTAEGKGATFSEFRVRPVRGHIRFWHRAAFGQDSAHRIWGDSMGHDGQGSHVAIRSTAEPHQGRRFAPLLPHKPGGQVSRPALPSGTAAAIQLQRLAACTNDDWAKATLAARLWLLAGTLGYRANRAAGSVWPDEPWAPKSREDLGHQLAPLISRPTAPWAAALVAEGAGKDWPELREAASDTPRGPASLFGSGFPRQPSPVKFKVISLANGLCLLAIAPSLAILAAAQTALFNKPGPRLWQALGQWKQL